MRWDTPERERAGSRAQDDNPSKVPMAQQNMNSVFYATTYHPIQAGSIDGTDTASHDNGVYRALVASTTGLYDPTGDPKAEGDPYCTLFVGRLARHTTEKTLHEVMSKYGRVKHLRLVRHVVTGASSGYAFVEFESEHDMQNAYKVSQHYVIDGSSILVDYNRQHLMPGWIPRRLGGGLGGRKESGQLRFGGRDRPFRAPLRTIPTEQLIKLGIPLPPVDQYISRFQLPPIPRRPGRSKEDSHRKQKLSYRQNPVHDTLPSKSPGEDESGKMEQQAEFSSGLGRRSVGAERGSSPHEEHSTRQRAEGDAEENISNKRNRDNEDLKQHKKRRRHAEQEEEQVDRRKPSRSSHEDRESSRHQDRGHEYVKEQKRSLSEQGDEQFDYENSARSSHEDRERSQYHERSRSSSRHKHRDSAHYETSTSSSGHRDRDGGHRHKRDRSTLTRESSAEYDRSPEHRSRHSQRKHRRKDD